MRRNFLLGLVVVSAGCIGTIDGGGGPSGDPAGGGGGGAAPDASVGTMSDGGAATMPDAPAFACRDKVTANIGSGRHNAGQDCQQGCHNHGFTLSGTLFTTATGNTPVVGASITVVDAAGKTFDMVTQQNGNFYTTNAVTFPVTVVASSCPDVQLMSGSIAAGSGGCNKTGCHTTAAQGRIHLP